LKIQAKCFFCVCLLNPISFCVIPGKLYPRMKNWSRKPPPIFKVRHIFWISHLFLIHCFPFDQFQTHCISSPKINAIKSLTLRHSQLLSVWYAYLMPVYRSYQYAFETLQFIDFGRVLFNFLLFHHFIGPWQAFGLNKWWCCRCWRA